MNEFIHLISAMFFIMNPLGNAPLFMAVLDKYEGTKQRKIILRELLVAFVGLLLFAFLGNWFFNALGISLGTIRVSGGIILGIIALSMIFPRPKDTSASQTEPFIVPLATPIILGPGSIAAVMVYSHQMSNKLEFVTGLGCAWVATTAILLASTFLAKYMNERISSVLGSIGGLILVMLGIQMLADGVSSIVV